MKKEYSEKAIALADTILRAAGSALKNYTLGRDKILDAASPYADDGFLRDKSAPERENPYVFLQWKNTDACFDFHCLCGAHCHFDGDFAYFVKCPHCSAVWEMPCILRPRRIDTTKNKEAKDRARMLQPDDELEN